MSAQIEALAAGMNEEIRRQTVVLESCLRRIKKLETAIRSSRALADHGVHGECGPVEACDEIHRLLSAALLRDD